MKQWVYCVILVLLLGLSGCKKQEAQEGQFYKIYYLNSSLTRLVPQDYVTETTDQEQLIRELLEQLSHVPKDLDCQTAVPDKVKLQKWQKEDMVLYLYFDVGYSSRSNMNAAREILCRAALAKTLTQMEGIDYISIYVGDQPLMNEDGNPVGMMTGSDFVESISDVNTFEKVEMTLYFTDETGQKLMEEKREVVHSINTSMEKLVMDGLIEGPKTAGRYPTLPPDVKLLNVSVNENVCYLNFDSGFLNNNLEVDENIIIYSIVNSLASLMTVNKVQITVNGSQDVMFRDKISLNTMFERNLDLGGIEN